MSLISTCLVFFKPREFFLLHLCKVLRTFHNKVDEVSAASESACDQEVGQNPEEASEMDVLIFLVLLFIHDGLLQQVKISRYKGNQLFYLFSIITHQSVCLRMLQHKDTHLLTLKLVVMEAYLLSAVSGFPIR